MSGVHETLFNKKKKEKEKPLSARPTLRCSCNATQHRRRTLSSSMAGKSSAWQRQVLPGDFFAFKASVRPLSHPASLVRLFVFVLIAAAVTFGGLFWFFLVSDTSTETVISGTQKQGYTCEMISSVPERTVVVPCGNRNASRGGEVTPGFCLTASEFGGIFFSGPGTAELSRATSLRVRVPANFFSTFQGCSNSWALSMCGLPSSPTITLPGKWTYTLDGSTESTPAIGADGTIYVGTSGNKLSAINPADGTAVWTYVAGGSCYRSSPAVGSDGTIYVGCGDSKLHAVHSNGSMKWSYLTGAEVQSSPTIGADGTIYVGSSDFKLHAVFPNGTMKWAYSTGGAVVSSPRVGGDGTVYIGSNDHLLHAVLPNGTRKWTCATGGAILRAPAIGVDGTIYVGSSDFKLHAINPDGSPAWNYTIGDFVNSAPAIGADGTIYIGSNDRRLHAVYPNGTAKWVYLTGDQVVSSPVIGSDGTIYIGSGDRKLHAVYPNGTGAWTYALAGRVFGTAAIGADGTIYIGGADGKLHFVVPSWSVHTGCSFSALAFDRGASFPFESAAHIFLPGATTVEQCSERWATEYCSVATTKGLALRTASCEAFEFHPPYSCTREIRRSILEAVSLSFSFAQLIYTALLFLIVKWLWFRFNRAVSSYAAANATSAGATSADAKTRVALNPVFTDDPEATTEYL
jgi:outer membrane protein assembly factor BamB